MSRELGQRVVEFAIVAVILSIVALWPYAILDRTCGKKPEVNASATSANTDSNSPVRVYVKQPGKGSRGYIAFTIDDRLDPMSRWGSWSQVSFVDEGFDGTLDRVTLVTRGSTIIDVREEDAKNADGTLSHPWVGVTWAEWQERYKFVRNAATFGTYEQP